MERHYAQEQGGDPMIFGDIERWRGATLWDKTGDEIGEIKDIYVDEESDRPEWVQVSTGLLGRSERLIPIVAFQRTQGGFIIPFTKGEVKDSPEIDEEIISLDQEQRLYSHYGITMSTEDSGSQLPRDPGTTEAVEEAPLMGPSVGHVIPTGTSGGVDAGRGRGRDAEVIGGRHESDELVDRREEYIGVDTEPGMGRREEASRSGAQGAGHGRDEVHRLRPPSQLSRASRMGGRPKPAAGEHPDVERRDDRAA